jgi:hypothetical protein
MAGENEYKIGASPGEAAAFFYCRRHCSSRALVAIAVFLSLPTPSFARFAACRRIEH